MNTASFISPHQDHSMIFLFSSALLTHHRSLPPSYIPLFCQSVELACFHFSPSCLHQLSLPSISSITSVAVKQLCSALWCCLHSSYLRQPAVLVRAVSHSRCLGLQFSSPPPAPLLPRSQPEWGTITSSERACSAWSTISIFTESWDDRFHSVPGKNRKMACWIMKPISTLAKRHFI